MGETFDGKQVNDVLRIVRAMSTNGDVQLSILARALVTACKSCQVEKGHAITVIGDLFDENTMLVPLAVTRT